MTPGTLVQITAGPWVGRLGTVENLDPEWAGVAYGSLLIRLRHVAGRPEVERVVVLAGDVQPVDLRTSS